MTSSSNITVRRSIPEDISHIRSLVSGPSADRYVALFGEDVNLSYEVETSFLCITALDARDNVIGFISLTDCPRQRSVIAPDVWHSWLRHGGQYVLDDDAFRHIYPCNTLWVSFLAVVESPDEPEVIHTMLTTAFATCAMIHTVLVMCPGEESDAASKFSSLRSSFFCEIPRTNRTTSQKTADCDSIEFSASIFCASRTAVIPPLRLRPGVVEDYDDFVPLLLAGDGVVTPLPTDLYLEELLQNQDTYHHVVVAEDPLTRQPVGLLCLSSTYEEQQHLVKQYATDIYSKLKPQFAQSVKGQQAGHNVFHLSFFYLNPAYDARSLQFVQHAFQLFPFAEYCFIFLPHAAAEHPILQYFANVPIKKFQPSNLQGERLPLPQGMWLCCRYSLENVSVTRIKPDQEDAVTKLLRNQPEISQEGVEAMCVALSNSIPLTAGQASRKDVPFATYVMQWREMIVGVMIVRFVNVDEAYALRENFDLDSLVNFLPNGDKPMHLCDITLDAEEAKRSFYTNDMAAVVVKHVYIKPMFRNRLRLLVREALRFSSTELLVYMASLETETFTPLIGELVLVPPRRMIDHPQNAQNPSGRDDTEVQEDVDSLACLYHTTRKALSDEKTKIHARIVVVGASTTGLAFIHSLLSIPYLNFTNILLVSTDGLPLHPNQQELCWNCDTLDFLEREYMTLRIGKRVRLLEGTMIDFDKFDKYICTDGSNCEPYDYLFITAGRQYAIPRELVSQHGAKNGVFPLCNQHYVAKIKQHIHESEIYEDDLSSAVIFGTNLDVFAVANNIIKLGLAPQRVVIVSPDSGTVNPFGDPLIELKVEELLLSMGTKILKAHVLERLEYDEDNNLSSVVVTPVDGNRGKSVEVNATMFIYVHDKDIDSQVLSALNKRSIVFDGRVIIENNYRTTDPNIFAAGPVAMFSRRFGKTEDFDVYSARDVGRHLSETLLGFIGIDEFYNPVLHKEDEETKGGPKDDPLAAELGSAKKGAEDVRRRPKALPKYEANISRKVMLPGDYMFFTCCAVNFASIESECTMLKSSSENGNNYVRIAVGPNKYIEAVSYFGSDPVEIYNLSSLVGLPESVLNLLYRYSEVNRNADPAKGTKPFNILEYMRSPWATAIFYDRFRKLFADIKGKLQDHPDAARVKADIVSLEVKDNTDKISDDDRDKYHRRLAHDQSDARHVIELEVLKYLHEARPFLPQLYFLPDITPYVPRYT